MRKIFIFLILVGFAFLVLIFKAPVKQSDQNQPRSTIVPLTTTLSTTVIAESLVVPWAIAFLPDKTMLVTERPGRVRFVDAKGSLDASPVVTVPEAVEIGEGGLLGIALHPDFSANRWVYLYYTYAGSGNNTFNRVVRMTYKDKKLINEQIIVDEIPGAANHNGGRIKFGPDKYLYITTGDAQNPSQAQVTNALGGKILRVTDDGKPAPGNPFNNLVYSYGHRNPQGLAWDDRGQLWSTEHGPSGSQTGNDEVNKIEPGKNYGWPEIQGDQKKEGMEKPVVNSGFATTWAPAGAVIISGSLFFSGLRGQALYQAKINDNPVIVNAYFQNEFGRIREVVVGPDGMLYITTSNRDGRGNPSQTDDKIIKINPATAI